MQLKHTTLYAKGWYEKTDNIFADLKKILTLDDYTPFTEVDVLYILLNEYQKIKGTNFNLLTFVSDIHPNNCWKIGYDIKAKEYDYYTVIIYLVLSEFRILSNHRKSDKKRGRSEERPR